MKDNSIVVKVNDRVSRGQKLAVMGATIGQNAIHLHMEVATPAGPASYSWQSPTQGYADTTIDPFDVLHKRVGQILEPDTKLGGLATDGKYPWYNIEKIEFVPEIY